FLRRNLAAARSARSPNQRRQTGQRVSPASGIVTLTKLTVDKRRRTQIAYISASVCVYLRWHSYSAAVSAFFLERVFFASPLVLGSASLRSRRRVALPTRLRR